MDIIERLERRDETAIELLKAYYGDYCYRIIYNQLCSHEETEEALNDVWLKIWNSIPPARPTHLRAYIAKVARNTAIDYIKCGSTQRRSGFTSLLDEIAEIVPDVSGTDGFLKDTLNRFLRSLGSEEQRIFLRRYWYGASIEELAEELGCSQTRIANILHRTRKKLRKHLEKEGYTV
jgi:RNA polymerase sigma-70 factor (ECF subfamily)